MPARDDITAQELADRIPDIVIITGMAGSGRTQAMHVFEDMGYFCVDNKDSAEDHLVFNRSVSLKDGFKKKKYGIVVRTEQNHALCGLLLFHSIGVLLFVTLNLILG